MNIGELIKDIYGAIFFSIFKLLPIKNKIAFVCFNGLRYGDNTRIISEKMYKDNKNIKQVWVYHDKKFKEIPKDVKQVKWGSIKMIYEFTTSKIWISTHAIPVWIYKRKGQYYINTWHGGLGMKKIEKDAESQLEKKSIRRIKINAKKVDLLVSNSDWLSDIYKRAFFYDGEIKKIGYPKDDFLLNFDIKEAKERVYSHYHFSNDCKYVLYAPTMRRTSNKDFFNLNGEKIIRSLKEKYGGQWKILIRLHPENQDYIKNIHLDENIINGTDYPDILELTMASEFLISDYSSCMFDATLIKNKALIYAPDEEEYRKERGLYVNLEEDLPFLVARDTDTLCNNLVNFDYNKYIEKVEEYYKKVGYIGDGHATEKIIKIIENKLK